ncbi:Gx transporter family protein [Alkalilimnicola sp. S0819]|uniref:Gx transporter family protein n=1 Tax=Alkalilimnicola sp. S0819 TaxID=2613922 RepID=UPI0012624816|nr:Gx transporter family protein [Alkalilimnicola sp. S0819]KAB7624467.1 Gx transporter family protein [Alkalilimnicola sp. S0819]MPQ16303.1 heptaprenyl diphosphate synthase [Alkalilimnicola sp. S0819]
MSVVQAQREDLRIAWLAALAIVIHVAESALPSPVPGIKPGLANIITVVVLLRFGWRAAAWVAVLRVLAGGLILGTFLSPTFILSLGGALAAVLALGLAARLPGIGAVGCSVLASMAHMGTQFLLAWQLFIPHPALLKLLPVLLSAALAFGIVNGLLAAAILRRLSYRP